MLIGNARLASYDVLHLLNYPKDSFLANTAPTAWVLAPGKLHDLVLMNFIKTNKAVLNKQFYVLMSVLSFIDFFNLYLMIIVQKNP